MIDQDPPEVAASVTEHSLATDIERCIVALLNDRAATASVCPSEVARAVGDERGENWRDLMSATRDVAVRMALSGRLLITRNGQRLDARDLGRGPIRLRRSSSRT